MKLHNDTRAGAGNGLNYIVAVALIAGMAYLLNIFAGYVIPMSSAIAPDAQTSQAVKYSEMAILYWPMVMLVTCCIWLIVQEVVDRRLGI